MEDKHILMIKYDNDLQRTIVQRGDLSFLKKEGNFSLVSNAVGRKIQFVLKLALVEPLSLNTEAG